LGSATKQSNILAPLLACGTAPHAPEWQQLGTSPELTKERFVDVSSVRIAASIRSAWIKTVYAKQTHTLTDILFGCDDLKSALCKSALFNKWLASSVSCVSFDCAAQQMSMGKVTWYFEDGTCCTDTLPLPWDEVPPGTNVESIMRFLCAWKPP
jgi:hypothetical protein